MTIKPMRITFILPHAGLAGGVKVVAIYAERLKKRGHTVTVVSIPLPPLSIKQKIKWFLKRRKWPIELELRPSHFDNVSVDHHVLKEYRPITNDDVPDADVVIATWWETAEWVKKFSETKGRKYYFIQHHEIFDNQPTDRVRNTYFLPFVKITISKWLMDLMNSVYGDKNVKLVKNSVDTIQFNCEVRCKNTNPVVGMMYSPVTWKGCDVSFRAFSIVEKFIPSLKMLSFGTSPPSSSTAVPKNFEFILLPPKNELKNIYSRCDVWICGSVYEGFHLPPLEAMACRCPVVSTAVGGPC